MCSSDLTRQEKLHGLLNVLIVVDMLFLVILAAYSNKQKLILSKHS